jgi:alkylation response protein AidB-like acyl-CoA dehydrogenase
MLSTLVSVDVASVKDAVEAILGLIRARAPEVEQARRLPDDVVLALRGTGINRMFMPTVLGGLQAPVLDAMDVVERIASVDGSTAWCAVIGAGSNVFAGYMPESGARQVFADPDQGSATMLAPIGTLVDEGGRGRLSGRWPFTSNCLHSAWIGVGAFVHGANGVDPVPRVAFVPAADLSIEDTWNVVGLRGTGSHHVVARDAVVEPDRCCAMSDRPWPDGTLWRLPLYTALIPALASVPLGIARGALDEVARQAAEGRTARRGPLADDPISMAELAAADAQLRGARAGLREAVENAHLAGKRGDPVDRRLQARVLLASVHASDASTAVASVAHQLGGGAATYVGSPLLRALCDAQASRQHLLFSHKHVGELAKVLAGLDVPNPPYVT